VTLAHVTPIVEADIVLAPKNGEVVIAVVDDESGWPVDPVQIVMCDAAAPQICFADSHHPEGGRVILPAPHVPFTLRVVSRYHHLWLGPAAVDTDQAIAIASGEVREFVVRLRRAAQWSGKPIVDAEKTPGVHLPAPVQVAPDDGAVLTAVPRRTRLEWHSVTGAATYRVELDFCDGRRDLVGCVAPRPLYREPRMDGIAGTSYEFLFIGAQPGRWRVVAVDSEGREGFFSPWRVFDYRR
jgi:hypothetical protein